MTKHKATVIITIAALISVLLSTVAFAHPGRTDSKGGHWDHSTGTYHYHDGSSVGKNSNSSSNTQSYDYNYYSSNNDIASSSYTGSNNQMDNFSEIDIIIAIVTALSIVAVVAFVVISIVDREYMNKFFDKHAAKFGIVFLIAIVIYLVFSTFEVNDINNFISVMIYGVPLILWITVTIKGNIDDKKRAQEQERLRNEQYKAEKQQYEELYSGRTINEILNLPDYISVGDDGLPFTPGEEKWGPIFTFYTSRDKYHSRHCQYAPLDWPVNAHRIKISQQHRPCRICQPKLPDTDWVDEYRELKYIFKHYKINSSKDETK